MIVGETKPVGIPIRDMATRQTFVLPAATMCVGAAEIDRHEDGRPDALRVIGCVGDGDGPWVKHWLAPGRNYAEAAHVAVASPLGSFAPGMLVYVRSDDRDLSGRHELWWLSRVGHSV